MTDPHLNCKMHQAIEVMLDSICKKLEEKEKTANIKFEMIHESIEVAKQEMDRRLEAMNEIRRQLDTQAKTFVTKIETDLRFKEIEIKYSPLLQKADETKGSKRWEDHIIEVLVGAAVLVGVYAMTHGLR